MEKNNTSKATMVIKPDAMNEKDFNYILSLIQKQNVLVEGVYIIKDFEKVMKRYRYADLIFKDPSVQQNAANLCNLALSAYSKMYPKGKGALIVINKRPDDQRDLFTLLKEVKTTVRETLKKRDPNFILIRNNNGKFEFRTIPQRKAQKFQQAHREWRIAKINGIHLEDRMCYRRNFCYHFMKSEGIICEANKIKQQVAEQLPQM